MQHFLSTADWTQEQLDGLLKLAADLKRDPIQDHLKGKSIALLFLNPSMRTRTSFDLGMQQLGGIAIVLQPGKDAWGVEFNPGVVMEGDAVIDLVGDQLEVVYLCFSIDVDGYLAHKCTSHTKYNICAIICALRLVCKPRDSSICLRLTQT